MLHISNSTNEKEVACLKEQFRRAFNESISEGQFVSFQHFNSTWDSFVDLEESDAVEDRDKLWWLLLKFELTALTLAVETQSTVETRSTRKFLKTV